MSHYGIRNMIDRVEQKVARQKPDDLQRVEVIGEDDPIGEGCEPGEEIIVIGGDKPGLYLVDESGEAQFVKVV